MTDASAFDGTPRSESHPVSLSFPLPEDFAFWDETDKNLYQETRTILINATEALGYCPDDISSSPFREIFETFFELTSSSFRFKGFSHFQPILENSVDIAVYCLKTGLYRLAFLDRNYGVLHTIHKNEIVEGTQYEDTLGRTYFQINRYSGNQLIGDVSFMREREDMPWVLLPKPPIAAHTAGVMLESTREAFHLDSQRTLISPDLLDKVYSQSSDFELLIKLARAFPTVNATLRTLYDKFTGKNNEHKQLPGLSVKEIMGTLASQGLEGVNVSESAQYPYQTRRVYTLEETDQTIPGHNAWFRCIILYDQEQQIYRPIIAILTGQRRQQESNPEYILYAFCGETETLGSPILTHFVRIELPYLTGEGIDTHYLDEDPYILSFLRHLSPSSSSKTNRELLYNFWQLLKDPASKNSLFS